MFLCIVLTVSVLGACRPSSPAFSGETDTANISPITSDISETASPPLPFDELTVVDISKAIYSYDEMTDDINTLASRNPELLTVTSAGKSLDGRDITVAILGNAEAKRAFIITAGTHGREYMTSQLASSLIEYTLLHKDDEKIAAALQNNRFYFVPMVNPDGITISQSGLDNIASETLRNTVQSVFASDKKIGYVTEDTDISDYLRMWKANGAGVDINRNFDARWEEVSRTLLPCFMNYKGKTPASEPETVALISLTNSLAESNALVATVALHAQGEVIYYNSGQEGDVRIASLDLAFAVKAMNGYSIIYEQSNDATYNDWCVLERGIPSVNIEIGSGGSCPLDISEFTTVFSNNMKLITVLAAYSTVNTDNQ